MLSIDVRTRAESARTVTLQTRPHRHPGACRDPRRETSGTPRVVGTAMRRDDEGAKAVGIGGGKGLGQPRTLRITPCKVRMGRPGGPGVGGVSRFERLP